MLKAPKISLNGLLPNIHWQVSLLHGLCLLLNFEALLLVWSVSETRKRLEMKLK